MNRPASVSDDEIIVRFRPAATTPIWVSGGFIVLSGLTPWLAGLIRLDWARIGFTLAALMIAGVALALPLARWLGRMVTITRGSVTVSSGVISRTQRSIALSRGMQIALKQSGLQRMLRWGDVHLVVAGETQLALINVPHAVLVQQTLAELARDADGILPPGGSQAASFGRSHHADDLTVSFDPDFRGDW